MTNKLFIYDMNNYWKQPPLPQPSSFCEKSNKSVDVLGIQDKMKAIILRYHYINASFLYLSVALLVKLALQLRVIELEGTKLYCVKFNRFLLWNALLYWKVKLIFHTLI